jgi:hypothetical protein
MPVRSGALAMGKLTTKKEIMPLLPVVFGLGELEAAAAIGISASKFRLLVSQKHMPCPRRLDGVRFGMWTSFERPLKPCHTKTRMRTKRVTHGRTWRDQT